MCGIYYIYMQGVEKMTKEKAVIYDKKKMIRMKSEMHEKLKDIADSRGDTLTGVIRDAIKAEIEYYESCKVK